MLNGLFSTTLLVASVMPLAIHGQEPMPAEQHHEAPAKVGTERQEAQHPMSNMPGMDHAGLEHGDMNDAGMSLMNESSGTGFQPAAWPMPMAMTRAGDWGLMWMRQAFIVDTQQSGPRGGTSSTPATGGCWAPFTRLEVEA